MRAGPEQTLFTTIPTQVVGVRACVLYVPEAKLRDETNTAEGTTLAAFMAGTINKGDALVRGFGAYVLTQAGELTNGLQAFYFAKQRTTEEIGTAFRSMKGVRQGIPWPAVFGSMDTGNLLAYDDDGTTSYVQGTVWKPVWAKKYYDGPVSTLEEWFASHAPFDIPLTSGMQPRSEVFDYGVGSYTLPECLHGELTLSYVIEECTRRPAQTASMTFDATTPTSRPSEIVLQDGQTFEDGLYIRKRLKAYEP